ncbi:hypothetical protein GPALN_005723 [Globodera pallida]|nr:hypothetical protein GPALN_005723 [Globodera pallida]
MNGEGLFAECAEVMESEEWAHFDHLQNDLRFGGFFGNQFINKTTNSTAIQIFPNADGLLEKDFQKALHLGAFMDEFNEMAFRILALVLLSAIGQNGTEWCKMKNTKVEMNATTATTATLD